MQSAIRLGLTGGIGSGKSTAAEILAAGGAAVVDADAIARDLTKTGGLAIACIASIFGSTFITEEQALDRDKMRQLIHADPNTRQTLESILHPMIAHEAHQQAAHAVSQGCRCIVFDIPLLVESTTWRQQLDHVLVIDCPPEIQVLRVMARNRMTRQEVEKIMASQATRARRLGAADSVIFNAHNSKDALAEELSKIAHRFGLSSLQPSVQRNIPA